MQRIAQSSSLIARRSLSVKVSNVKDKLPKKGNPGCQPAGSPAAAASDRRAFKIYRYPGVQCKEKPRLDSFEIDIKTCGPMILDALIKIKEIDPSLTFRRSCREGICGSCAINLQGNNCLACTTAIPKDKTIKIYPLPHMYVIRDLVVDMTHFIKGYNSIRPYLVKNPPVEIGKQQLAQSQTDSAKLVGLYECVLCACCSTSCPSYWWNGRRFLGPATLLHAYRWVIDSRDDDAQRRLKDLSDDFKAFRCHAILNCSLVCPKNLNPGQVIAKLKHLIASVDSKPRPQINPMAFSGKENTGKCAKPPVKKC